MLKYNATPLSRAFRRFALTHGHRASHDHRLCHFLTLVFQAKFLVFHCCLLMASAVKRAFWGERVKRIIAPRVVAYQNRAIEELCATRAKRRRRSCKREGRSESLNVRKCLFLPWSNPTSVWRNGQKEELSENSSRRMERQGYCPRTSSTSFLTSGGINGKEEKGRALDPGKMLVFVKAPCGCVVVFDAQCRTPSHMGPFDPRARMAEFSRQIMAGGRERAAGHRSVQCARVDYVGGCLMVRVNVS